MNGFQYFMDISLQLSILLWMSVWISMDSYGCPFGYPLIPMDIHGFLWISMDIHLDNHRFLWISMDIHLDIHICLDIHATNCYGFSIRGVRCSSCLQSVRARRQLLVCVFFSEYNQLLGRSAPREKNRGC